MFFENNYISLSDKSEINYIYSYKNIITKFVNNFIKIYKDIYLNDYKKNIINLYEDSIIYSKYFLYYKTINCVYDDDIMEILFNVENFSS